MWKNNPDQKQLKVVQKLVCVFFLWKIEENYGENRQPEDRKNILYLWTNFGCCVRISCHPNDDTHMEGYIQSYPNQRHRENFRN